MLVDKAMKTSQTFRDMGEKTAMMKAANGSDPLAKAADDIIDFKTAALKGIQAGQIKSIIHPALGDHVRMRKCRR